MVGRHAAGTRRAALTAFGALVLTGLPGLPGLPAAAEAAPPPAPGPARSTTAAHTLGADRPSAQVLRAMVRDLKLTRSQAVARLVNEAEAGARAGRLHNALGGHFAGAWVSGATSAELTVATTHAADVTAIRAQGAKAKVVKAPLSTLQTVKEKLDAAARRARNRDTPVWYVDVPTNRVVVEATSRPAGTTFVKAAGVEGRGVAVRVTAIRPRLMTDIVGGDAYYIDGSARCSVGFSVTKGQQQGFVSAGHCGTPGAKTTGFNKADQGTFQASTFPGKDMSWVGVNSDWTATPDVKGQGGQRTQIAGSVQALVGASVCRSGSTTGWHCGTIQQLSATVDYSEGTVRGLTRTNVCSEPGDSGGPFVSGAQAQGVTSGGSGDCTSGGTTFFQPVNPILSDFGLTLKTAAAQTGTPDPQDNAASDAWFAGRVYEVGATVTHAGVRYQCLQSHQAQGAWSPESTPALWQRI
ncbi:alpha-lytic protease prodomain-containing protein [Streptomyces sp. NBC_00078]|uniref:alpha-lytic protease prodomain-containing protein n=1 Tax=unclassified Streptomyces TaxID=2593676 RepID=UPI002258C669|nr:alpha-lytic protease prodomain-containing protein [Streptomyces sp. NBC_00078]MCX5419051.1 alpha-lytic protease prodomain-containing protein [Streptomyces sp. NBC_00078]